MILRLELRSALAFRLVTGALAALLTVVLTRAAGAQDSSTYGYTPQQSPYHDVQSSSELSLFTGYLFTARDLAGVEPKSAPVVGVREMVHLGGPIIFLARVTHSFSDRTVINPTAPASSRPVGTQSDGLTIADVDLGLNFTGDRSWHYLVPYFTLGPGVVSDLGPPRDAGDYRFGTSFAATYGGGFRYVTAGRFSAHLDMNAYQWEYVYPPSYHSTAIDGTQVIPTNHRLRGWRNNGLVEIGVSYQIF